MFKPVQLLMMVPLKHLEGIAPPFSHAWQQCPWDQHLFSIFEDHDIARIWPESCPNQKRHIGTICCCCWIQSGQCHNCRGQTAHRPSSSIQTCVGWTWLGTTSCLKFAWSWSFYVPYSFSPHNGSLKIIDCLVKINKQKTRSNTWHRMMGWVRWNC